MIRLNSGFHCALNLRAKALVGFEHLSGGGHRLFVPHESLPSVTFYKHPNAVADAVARLAESPDLVFTQIEQNDKPIALDPKELEKHPLRVGLSMKATVDVP